MVGEEVLAVLPEELVTRLEGLITLFKALGVVTIIYLVWLLVKGFFTMKAYKKIDKISRDVNKIKKKLKIKG